MKILIVSPFFYPAYVYGGPIEYLYQVGKNWVAQGHFVRVVTTNANGNEVFRFKNNQPQLINGMVVYYCKRLFSEAVSFTLIWRLNVEIKKADIVCLSQTYSFPTFLALFFCNFYDKKLIWVTHGALQEWKGTRKKLLKFVWNQLCRVIIPRDAVMLYTSLQEANEGKKKFPLVRYIIIPSGVAEKVFIRKKTVSAITRLLFLGRIDHKKGLENLILAVAGIDQSKYVLNIYGAGRARYIKALNALAVENKCADVIFWHGPVAHSEIDNVFCDSDVLVLPSYTENFGIVVLEALSNGVPVIASRNTPWQELEHYRCGLWVENDPENLRKSILKIREMPLEEMGRNGRNLVKQKYQWSEIARRIIDESIAQF